MTGLVLNGSNNVFEVECEDSIVRRCSIKGKVLKHKIRYYNALAPGDIVEVEIDSHDESEARILNLVERKNLFPRLNEKTNTPQILAANIDLILCLTTPDKPEFRPVFVDRVLVQAQAQDIPVIVVVNKIDLGMKPHVKDRIQEWQTLGYNVMFVCAKEKKGIDELILQLANKTVCIIGQSGVGKSTLLNSIEPNLKLSTCEISVKQNKGSHTTTKAVFYKITKHLNNTVINIRIIDTPGVKNFSLYDIEKQDIAFYFPEMQDAIGKCKFGLSCSHKKEIGCEIQKRLEEKSISLERYESYLNMIEELNSRN